ADLAAARAGGTPAGFDHVGAAEAIDDQAVGLVGMIDGHLRRKAVDDDLAADRSDGDGVIAASAVDGDAVDLAVADGPAERRGQVDGDLLDVRARELADVDGVGFAAGVEFDALDVVEVHGDVRDIAEEAHPLAIGRDVDGLGDVGAVEDERVGPAPAFDDVVAVARIPLEGVVAGAEEGGVVALVAVDEVVAVAADQTIRAAAAADLIVAGPAVDRQRDHVGEQGRGGDDIVAAAGLDRQAVADAVAVADADECRQADHREVVAGAKYFDRIAAGGARDRHRIQLAIALIGAGDAREVDVDLGGIRPRQVVHRNVVGPAARLDLDG